jgi:hypothetical protein
MAHIPPQGIFDLACRRNEEISTEGCFICNNVFMAYTNMGTRKIESETFVNESDQKCIASDMCTRNMATSMIQKHPELCLLMQRWRYRTIVFHVFEQQMV